MPATSANERYLTIGTIGLVVVGLLVLAVSSKHFYWNPYSLIVVLPALLTSMWSGESIIGLLVGAAVGISITPVIFRILGRRLIVGKVSDHGMTIIVFLALFALSAGYGLLTWETTAAYTSVARAVALLVQSVLPPVLIGAFALYWRKNTTDLKVLAYYWCTCAWITWSAFPWHGEMM